VLVSRAGNRTKVWLYRHLPRREVELNAVVFWLLWASSAVQSDPISMSNRRSEGLQHLKGLQPPIQIDDLCYAIPVARQMLGLGATLSHCQLCRHQIERPEPVGIALAALQILTSKQANRFNGSRPRVLEPRPDLQFDAASSVVNRIAVATPEAKQEMIAAVPTNLRLSNVVCRSARMMAIAAGYEDADDLDALRDDPALMIACDRAPETGRGIPSQPTISRLENLADTRTLYRIGTGFIDLFCRSYARPPASIVLDIDDTDDLVHGQQELALFNTHAGGHCFQPIHIFEAGSGKPILSLLRPGKRPSGEEIARVLAHVIHRIRRCWPKVAILVRGDGHYCAPEVLDLLRQKRCDYILGLSRNKTLDALAEPWREQCRWRWKPGIGKVRRFHQFQYAAESSSDYGE
jgi:hypothetical protein